MEGVQLDVRIRSFPDDLMTQDLSSRPMFVPEPGTNIAPSDCREWPAVLGAGFAYPIEDQDEDYLANVERLPRSLHMRPCTKLGRNLRRFIHRRYRGRRGGRIVTFERQYYQRDGRIARP